tara:strand:+ start:1622 stop:2701 length:1080 start_codon:yes stop_codon:yes gene_type:complete
MKVGIIGNNLTCLVLAKALVNQEIFVDIFNSDKKIDIDKTRSIGISKSNIDYFNKNISNINKFSWPIKKIKIYSENSNNEEIIKFKNKSDNLFSIIENYKLFNQLKTELKKNKFFKYKNNISYKGLNKINCNLIINCDQEHEITKKFFSKKFEKKYESIAYTTLIDHKILSSNDTAIQIFTKKGPIAFLPLSNKKTSVVYSVQTKRSDTFDIKNSINKFNLNYQIKKINKVSKFNLKSSNLRKYYKNNILAFGDILHKLHPLAGQGFNMTLRDIKNLLEIINNKIELGLPLDQRVCLEFQKKVKSNNLIFSEGINFIYESFNFKNKIKGDFIDRSVKLIGKNKLVNKYLKKIADEGLQI